MGQYFQGLFFEPDCFICPLKHDRKVLPNGPVPAKLCFVGEGPGYNEVQEGQGFVGRSGALLWALAGAYGIRREEVWVTNTALCRPRDVRLESGVLIKDKQVRELSMKACRRRLIYELLCVTENSSKSVIVPIGKLALQALSVRRNVGIFAYRGSVMEIDLQKAWAEAEQQIQVGW